MLRRYLPRLHALVLADYTGSTITKSTLSSVAASQELSKKTSLAIFSNLKNGPELAKQAQKISNIHQIVLITNDSFTHLLSDTLGKAIFDTVAKLGDVTHIVGSTSSVAKDVLPRLAALMDVQPVSDVVEILSPDTVKRPMYAGNVLAKLKLGDGVKIISIRPTAFDNTSAPASSDCPIVSMSIETSPSTCTFLSASSSEGNKVDLSTASIVVAGGRGLQSEANFQSKLEPLAKKLNAALGASRAAVDAGFAPNDVQIGQTGKVVAPALYIAVGISGAIQHVAGMKDSKTIVAINKDGDAPIFQIADFGLVGDLNLIIPELIQKL